MQTDVGGMITARILDELSCWCRDKADYEQFSYVVDVFVVVPLLAFGLAGNTLYIALAAVLPAGASL